MRTTSCRLTYLNPGIRVREDVIERPDGSTGLYGVVERPDFALVVPAERDGLLGHLDLRSRPSACCSSIGIGDRAVPIG